MTSLRASAYGRVLRTIRETGPTLWPREEACIRDAADTLLFCVDLDTDEAARSALATLAVLTDELIDAERWAPERAQRLLDDLWACGPWEPQHLAFAA